MDALERFVCMVDDWLELVESRIECAFTGHRWDSDRPAGPIHVRDICWRCDKVRGTL